MRKRTTTTVVEHGITPGFALTAAGLVLALGVVTGQLNPGTLRTIRQNVARSWAIWEAGAMGTDPEPLDLDARIVDDQTRPFSEGGER